MIKGLGGAKLPQAPSPETTPMSYDQFGFVLLKLALLGFVFFNTEPRDCLGRTSPNSEMTGFVSTGT